MSYLDNGTLKVGVDLNRGGALVFLARNGEPNLINNFDLGRQVQLSFFSGPVPFEVNGQKPTEHWKHIGWNPIQTGDDFDNPSRILAHENDGQQLYVKCQPMQWPLNNIPGDCTFESWLKLEGPVVKVRARLNNARLDHQQYRARLQELPAVYTNAEFHRVISYTGNRPFTNDAVTAIPKSTGNHPWSFWLGTEQWAALLNPQNRGLGLITPGRIHFTGGFAGRPGPNDTLGNSTGYLASQAQEILDHNIGYEFRYELLPGSLQEIRARAATHQPTALPSWNFGKDRQSWHLLNATDTGWPIAEHLHVRLAQNDPQLISPYFLVQAEKAPYLIIEAAFKTRHQHATLFWQSPTDRAPTKDANIRFPIEANGEFKKYTIDLSTSPAYHGDISRLRFDPVPSGEPGDWVKVKSIRFGTHP